MNQFIQNLKASHHYWSSITFKKINQLPISEGNKSNEKEVISAQILISMVKHNFELPLAKTICIGYWSLMS